MISPTTIATSRIAPTMIMGANLSVLNEIRELGGCLDSLAGADREYAAWES